MTTKTHLTSADCKNPRVRTAAAITDEKTGERVVHTFTVACARPAFSKADIVNAIAATGETLVKGRGKVEGATGDDDKASVTMNDVPALRLAQALATKWGVQLPTNAGENRVAGLLGEEKANGEKARAGK